MAFIMTPVLVRNLGNHDYGIWEITFSLVGYFGFLEVGLRPAVTRFAARYRSLNQHEELDALYANATFFLGVSGLIAFLSFVGWAILGPASLAEPGEPAIKYRWFLLIIGLQLLIVMPSYVAESILDGFQKFHLKNLITAINTLIGTSLVLALIDPDNALVLVAGFNVGGVCLKYMIYQRMIRRERMGGIRWQPSLIGKARIRGTHRFRGQVFHPRGLRDPAVELPEYHHWLDVGCRPGRFLRLAQRAMPARAQRRHAIDDRLHADVRAILPRRGKPSRAREVFFPVTSIIVAMSTLAAMGIFDLGPEVHLGLGWSGIRGRASGPRRPVRRPALADERQSAGQQTADRNESPRHPRNPVADWYCRGDRDLFRRFGGVGPGRCGARPGGGGIGYCVPLSQGNSEGPRKPRRRLLASRDRSLLDPRSDGMADPFLGRREIRDPRLSVHLWQCRGDVGGFRPGLSCGHWSGCSQAGFPAGRNLAPGAQGRCSIVTKHIRVRAGFGWFRGTKTFRAHLSGGTGVPGSMWEAEDVAHVAVDFIAG